MSSPSAMAAISSSSRQRASSSRTSNCRSRRSSSSFSEISSATAWVRRCRSRSADPESGAHELAGHRLGRPPPLDVLRGTADPFLGGSPVVAVRDHPPEDVPGGGTLDLEPATRPPEPASGALEVEGQVALRAPRQVQPPRSLERQAREGRVAADTAALPAPGRRAESAPPHQVVKPVAAHEEPEHPAGGHGRSHGDCLLRPPQYPGPGPAADQVAAVAPPRLLAQRGLTHPDQLDTGRLDERDVGCAGQHTTGVALGLLQLFERLPALLERRQVPAVAGWTHGPETGPAGIEGNARPEREVLHRLVGRERAVTENAPIASAEGRH